VLRLDPAQSETLRLDGILSEDFWREVAAIDDFRQQEPEEGAPATERTEDGEIPVDRHLDVGLDLKSALLPGLVLDLTLNTDFAPVEVGDEQVNLTRFSLFYPEKRDFFLENSGIFHLGLAGGYGHPRPSSSSLGGSAPAMKGPSRYSEEPVPPPTPSFSTTAWMKTSPRTCD
jgi:hypothetical protein